MDREISVTEAARTFADLVARAFYRRESAKLMKNGRPVARIVPIVKGDHPRSGAELANLWNDPKRIRLSPEELSNFEAGLNEARKSLPVDL
jgi:antitoxin (DNA-binding transcriptional repressor) of toxin-antitoxin stability system